MDAAHKKEIQAAIDKALGKQRMPNLKTLEPEPFNGNMTEVSAQDWISRLEGFFKLSGFTEEDKLTMLPLLLRSVALIWHDTIIKEKPDNERNTYAKIKQLFLARFDDSSQKWMLQTTLDHKILRQNDNIEPYIMDIIKLAHKLGLTSTETCSALLRHVYGDLKAYIISCSPGTLQETLEKLRLGHTLQAMKSPQINRIETDTMVKSVQDTCDNLLSNFQLKLKLASEQAIDKVNNISSAQQNANGTDSNNIRTDTDTNYMYTRSSPFQGRAIQGTSPQRSMTNFQQQRNTYQSDIVCYYCNKKGHISRDCFSKARDMGRAQSNQGQNSNTWVSRNSQFGRQNTRPQWAGQTFNGRSGHLN
jgi:hypothetical protein